MIALSLRRAGLIFAFLALASAVTGCTKPPAAAVKAAPPDVFVEKPITRGVVDYEDFTGRTEAYKIHDVRPEVTGRLKSIEFSDGAFVSAGDLLFVIEDELYQAASKKAAADVEKARADILNWDAQILLAKAELRRANKTLESSAAAQTDVDKATATLAVNTAQLAASKAMLEAANAALNTANIQLSYCKIRSQYTGRISRRMIDAGNIVKANETVLTRLVVLDPIYVSFDIDERTVLMLRKLVANGKRTSARDSRLNVQVGLADEDGYSFKDVPITFANNELDANTGTLRIRAEMENPSLQVGLRGVASAFATIMTEHKGLKLLSPGMFVRVRMPVGKEHPGVLIPEEALVADQGQRFVYVVDREDKAVYRRVKLGPQEGKLRVIDEGLTTGDRVIVSGLQRVKDHMTVNPRTKPSDAKGKK